MSLFDIRSIWVQGLQGIPNISKERDSEYKSRRAISVISKPIPKQGFYTIVTSASSAPRKNCGVIVEKPIRRKCPAPPGTDQRTNAEI